MKENYDNVPSDDNFNDLKDGCVLSQDLNCFLNLSNPSSFLFRMSSDAMTNMGILKGDIVICRRDLIPSDGDIVLIASGGRFMIRKFEDGKDPKLISGNLQFPDIDLYRLKDVDVFGVVSSVVRKKL